MSLFIEYNNQTYDLEFEGIKLFQVKNPNQFTKEFYLNAIEGKYSNVDIFKNNIMIISDFTKIDEFIILSKSSEFFKDILNKLIEMKFIDENKVLSLIDSINELYEFEIIEHKPDFNKIVANLLEINEKKYLDKNLFLKFLDNKIFSQKITFIINDVDWLKINDIKKYLNNYNFIFITNDLRKNINNINDFEICCIVNEKIFEVMNWEILVSYLEKETNLLIDHKTFDYYLKNINNDNNFKIAYNLNFLEKNL